MDGMDDAAAETGGVPLTPAQRNAAQKIVNFLQEVKQHHSFEFLYAHTRLQCRRKNAL